MRRIFAAIALTISSVLPVQSENYVPNKRLVYTSDADFPGSDLQALFDTTLNACQNLCLNDDQCRAFTFNQAANACFPKSAVNDRIDFENALSARAVETDARVLSRAEGRAGDIASIGTRTLEAARNQAINLGQKHRGGRWSVEVLLDTVEDRKSKGNMKDAIYWLGAALSQNDAPDLWLEYARLNRDFKSSDAKLMRRNKQRALPAAVNGYLRAGTKAQQVSALMEIAQGLKSVGRGKDMIPILRLAEDLQPRDDVIALLEEAIARYGFRITEHRVDTSTETPRICVEFNEKLEQHGVDYETYVRMPSANMAVTSGVDEICVAGAKHGERVTLTFRKGLPAQSNESLIRDVEITAYIRDRDPSVSFPGRAYVLPKTADAGIPIETVNVAELDLKLYAVSDRNLLRAIQTNYVGRPLSYWQERRFRSEIAETVWEGTGHVQEVMNRDVTTRLPMGSVIADLEPGLYALSATRPGAGRYDESATMQWFVLTDLGIATYSGVDGLHVDLRSLTDTSAIEGAELTLLSRSNRVLGRMTTGADGHVHFPAGLTRGTGSAAPALVTAKLGEVDYTFLSLTDPAFDLSDRGVEGREPSPPIDVFLATDRGAYRTGEVIHATVLARDGVAAGITGLPMTAILTRPDGVEYSRILSSDDRAGGHVFTLPLGRTAPRGTWRLDIKSDPDAAPLASRKLLVEDFLPERIDFTLALPDMPFRPGDFVQFDVDADYLFGAPGADLKVEGEVRISAVSELDGYAGYQFGQHDERFHPLSNHFSGVTDANGIAQIDLRLPKLNGAIRPTQANFITRVKEGSGRPVERRESRALAPASTVIGIRPQFADNVVPEGDRAQFHLIAVDRDLAQTTQNVRWTLNRLRTRYYWYQEYGNWNWERSTTQTEVASGTAALGADPVLVEGDVDWGHYELVVESASDATIISSVDFYASWYAPADGGTTPDTLELSLDRPDYRAGDTAQLRIVPRYAGTAMVTVMSNRVIDRMVVEVAEGENLIPIPVTADWGAGAYVAASVIRPMDAEAGQNPARALGIAYGKVDPGDKQLSVTLDAPTESAPRGPLVAGLTIDGAGAGDTVFATVAAVDVGILNLTGFQSPDPSGHYFGQRRLGVEMRDVYGRLIDGSNGAMGEIRSGGDAARGMSAESPPPTEELVAYFSGPVTVGADGRAEVSFDIPEFNGTVRLMAVAWSGKAVGEAEADVLVRDPVVVTASLPRFMAPGDQSRMLLEIVHTDGPAGRMGLDVTATGVAIDNGQVPSGITLAEKGKVTLQVPIIADQVGDHSLTVVLNTPDGKRLTKTLLVPVRSNDPEISATRRLSLAPGKTLTLDDNIMAGLIPGSGSVMLSAGPLASFDTPGLLTSLDRYPSGCTEQVTSRAMPLLYFSAVADAMGMTASETVDKRIAQSIERVLSRQSSNGAFGLWYPTSGDFWLDAYVTDFLSRARAKGHEVPQIAFRNALDNLRNRINYAPDFDSGGEDIAYALMVLAREGAATMGDLRYYSDVKPDAFTTPLAAAQVGAALASYGDQTRADRMFTRASALLEDRWRTTERTGWRVDYGTRLRDTAGVLALAVEAGSSAIHRDALTTRIAAARGAMSTQEHSWTLLAAHAMIDDPSISGLQVNGDPVLGPLIRNLSDRDLASAQQITNTGANATDVTLTTFGKPDGLVDASGYGFSITRNYFDMEGNPVTGPIHGGDRMVVVLKVSPAKLAEARLIVNDPLPAGLEIDNPNLVRAGDIKALSWLKPATTQHSEFRADRFIAAVDHRSRTPFELAYIVRAISPGDFHHPSAVVEDMYRPVHRARTASGRMTIAD